MVVVGVVVLVAMIGVGVVFSGVTTDVPGEDLDPTEKKGMEKPRVSPASGAATTAPDPAAGSEEPTAKTDVQERPPPSSPAEEGLYALADAAGEAVIRCDLSGVDVPDNLFDNAVLEDDQLTMGVPPNDGSGTEGIKAFLGPDGQGVSVHYSDAFVGGIGGCRVQPMKIKMPSAAPLKVEDLGVTLDEVAEQIEVKLDDVDEEMNPIQVALETPGLSDGARAWLEDRLDDGVRSDEAALDAIDDIEDGD